MSEGTGRTPLLEARGVSKHFVLANSLLWRLRARPPVTLKAVDGVSLSIYRGETVGLVRGAPHLCAALQHGQVLGEVRMAADQSPEEGAAVLAILLEAGVLRYEDDGTLLRLGDDGRHEVLCPQ